MSEKACTRCGHSKPLFEFGKDARNKNGLKAECKACARAYANSRPRENINRIAMEGHFRRSYGLTQEALRGMKEAVRHCCEICGERVSRLVVDHNHATGEVRGMLCTSCNSGIGQLKDSPSVLEAALAYLTSRGFYGNCSTGASAPL